MERLPVLLAAYRRGDPDVVRGLSQEVEPLLFGYARSRLPAGERERAIASAHQLLLAFHVSARDGRLALASVRELKAWCHRAVERRIAGGDPGLRLVPFVDDGTGTLAPSLEIYDAVALNALAPDERRALADRLLGEEADPEAWASARRSLAEAGVVR